MDWKDGVSEASLLQAEADLSVSLPDDYRAFVRRNNGGAGVIGEQYVELWKVEELRRLNDDYGTAEFRPGFLLIGSNGGGESFAFDMRSVPWNMVMLPFIGDVEDAIPVGRSFTEFLSDYARDPFWTVRLLDDHQLYDDMPFLSQLECLPKAEESALESAEAALGVKLPQDYRSFLLRCDGAHNEHLQLYPAGQLTVESKRYLLFGEIRRASGAVDRLAFDLQAMPAVVAISLHPRWPGSALLFGSDFLDFMRIYFG